MGVRNECDRLTCVLNGKYDFELHFHQTNEESFYWLKRRQLGEYWCGVIKDCQTFWPDKCDKCNICKDFVVVLEYLQDAYFFCQTKIIISRFCGEYFSKLEINFVNLE